MEWEDYLESHRDSVSSAQDVAELRKRFDKQKAEEQRYKESIQSIANASKEDIPNQLKEQNRLLSEQNEALAKELKSSKRFNLIMLIIAVVSMVFTVASYFR